MGHMPVTTARLRTLIALAAGLLIAAITGFFIYGRWQGRHFSGDLPDGLSSTIQQSTDGFTYSESRGGHTIYTLHAARAVQFKNTGHAELHDVSITLYGAQGSAANRIYGSDFDWDPVHGIARATGEVQIDFQASAASSSPNTNQDTGGKDTVHVKTSGLIFNKKTGEASTAEKIEFHLAQAAGSATGASFDSQTGVVVLLADVAFNSSINGNALAVRARHAQYDRASRILYLIQEATDYSDSHSSSDQATISFRTDGSAYQAEAEGKVIFTNSDGQRLTTRRAHVDLGPRSEPQRALLDGGLLYVSDTDARELHGSASTATLLLTGAQATIRHAQLRDAVTVVDEEKLPAAPVGSKQNPPQSTTRQLGATQLDIDFVPGPDRRPVAQHILANGTARLNVHTIYAKTPPEDSTVQGDQLFATLVDGEVLSSLRGTGHTSLAMVSPNGQKQSSTGDNLLMTFAPPQTKGQAQPAARLQSAVQTGNVTVRQEPAPTDKPGVSVPVVSTATAQRGEYDAATQLVRLSGDPRIHDPNGEISAAAIEVERLNGNAYATGSVKATYQSTSRQSGMTFTGSGPVHVVADHAHLDHAKDITTFFGNSATAARLWQGSDSIAAPILEISRLHGTLAAHGNHEEANAVNAVFTSNKSKSVSPAPPGHAAQTSVVRLQSRTLLYVSHDEKAVFSGAVTAQTSAGLLHSNFLDIYFSPSPGKAADQQASQQASQVSKIVARGAVQLEQPGRKGNGDELTYTADDGKFLLTGSSASPPHLNDQVRGSVTGSALIFNDRDDSVIVKGGDAQAVTQTRVAR